MTPEETRIEERDTIAGYLLAIGAGIQDVLDSGRFDGDTVRAVYATGMLETLRVAAKKIAEDTHRNPAVGDAETYREGIRKFMSAVVELEGMATS